METESEESFHKILLVIWWYLVYFAAQFPKETSEGCDSAYEFLSSFKADAIDLVEIIAPGKDTGGEEHTMCKPCEVGLF